MLTKAFRAEWVAMGVREGQATLDHFMPYGVRPAKGHPAFVARGPVTLADAFGGRGCDVGSPVALGLPADKNAGGRRDATTHLLEYRLKPARKAPTFAPRIDVHLLSQ